MRLVLRNVKSVPLLATIRSRILGKDILLRFLKITVASFLLFLAGLSMLAEISSINIDSGSTWHQHVAKMLFISLCVCSAYLLLRRPVDPVAEVYCPRCTAFGGHATAPEYGTSVSPIAWHLGGFLLSIFYSGGKQQQFRCRECSELFSSHTAVSRGYRLLFLLFVAIIVNYIWSDLSEIFAE
jgi:hypothetical protein